MLAIDTNVIVRALIGDEPDQSRRARALLESEAVFVSTTVLLETEWVLRSAYRVTAADTAEALKRLAGLPNVSFEAPVVIEQSLDWMTRGMDFADALHLTAARDCAGFATFDRNLGRMTGHLDAVPVRAP
ncbi:MAG: type II toxin-antitoxin system VapC family toxin [Caulobacteraceae bacterium]